MTPKYSLFCDDPNKTHKIFIPKRISFFSENHKNVKFKILNPRPPPKKKNKTKQNLSLRMYENIRVLPPPPPPQGNRPHLLMSPHTYW